MGILQSECSSVGIEAGQWRTHPNDIYTLAYKNQRKTNFKLTYAVKLCLPHSLHLHVKSLKAKGCKERYLFG
ncbi:hypothetical protein BTA51_15380 [Hahella sp. CCB-MM4]|nr:hypothetical protein BTA51_15380 [Hahella sp. CCB-MM4]